jgi:hypothetical protein
VLAGSQVGGHSVVGGGQVGVGESGDGTGHMGEHDPPGADLPRDGRATSDSPGGTRPAGPRCRPPPRTGPPVRCFRPAPESTPCPRKWAKLVPPGSTRSASCGAPQACPASHPRTVAAPRPAAFPSVPNPVTSTGNRRCAWLEPGNSACISSASRVRMPGRLHRRGPAGELAVEMDPQDGILTHPAGNRTRTPRSCEDVRSRGSGFWLAGCLRGSPAGPDAHSSGHRGGKEDQWGCYGTRARRYERGARFGPDIGSGRWWRWIETERFGQVMPPGNLKVAGVPAEYPDDAADPPQPSHRRISGSCHRCTDLVYHGCRLATCSPAVPDDRHSAG